MTGPDLDTLIPRHPLADDNGAPEPTNRSKDFWQDFGRREDYWYHPDPDAGTYFQARMEVELRDSKGYTVGAVETLPDVGLTWWLDPEAIA